MAIGEAVNEFMRHHPNLSSLIIPNLVEAVDLLQATFRKTEFECTILMGFQLKTRKQYNCPDC